MIFPLSQGNTKETSAQKVTKITKRYLGRNVSAYRRIGVSAYRRIGGSAGRRVGRVGGSAVSAVSADRRTRRYAMLVATGRTSKRGVI
jgi:hypothetical protein